MNIPSEVLEVHKQIREVLNIPSSAPYYFPYYFSLIIQMQGEIEQKSELPTTLKGRGF